MQTSPIGIFDSGLGGLTVLKELYRVLPDFDYLYLGDQARAPYGPRSFEEVYEYTKEAVSYLFKQGCPLIVLACNTASAKALRSIQQTDLNTLAPGGRVLGVIRPTTEQVGLWTKSAHVAVLATEGTVNSNSYAIEIEKFFPHVHLTQMACPLWVPIVEKNQINDPSSHERIKKDIDDLLARDPLIDTLILGCTHYPLLSHVIQMYLPKHIRLVSQGEIVAQSLKTYLNRHPELSTKLSQQATQSFLTTDDPERFVSQAQTFWPRVQDAKKVTL